MQHPPASPNANKGGRCTTRGAEQLYCTACSGPSHRAVRGRVVTTSANLSCKRCSAPRAGGAHEASHWSLAQQPRRRTRAGVIANPNPSHIRVAGLPRHGAEGWRRRRRRRPRRGCAVLQSFWIIITISIFSLFLSAPSTVACRQTQLNYRNNKQEHAYNSHRSTTAMIARQTQPSARAKRHLFTARIALHCAPSAISRASPCSCADPRRNRSANCKHKKAGAQILPSITSRSPSK